jgi:hypothetical protein
MMVIAERYVHAIERGDADTLISMLTEDATWSMPPIPTWFRGRIDCEGANAHRDGRWQVPQRMEIRAKGGNVKLDFTEAEVTWPSLRIRAQVHGGNLTLVTKPGTVVDTDEVRVRGGTVRVRAPWGSDVPVTFRIDVSGEVHGGNFTSRPPRPPRRTFWQWLRRRPRSHTLPQGPAAPMGLT